MCDFNEYITHAPNLISFWVHEACTLHESQMVIKFWYLIVLWHCNSVDNDLVDGCLNWDEGVVRNMTKSSTDFSTEILRKPILCCLNPHLSMMHSKQT
jgi:hypothetical protein